MDLYASHAHPHGYGGGPAFYVSDYLGADPIDFGSAIDTIEVQICNDGGFQPTLSPETDKPKPPSCRFMRKRRKLIITWPGSHHNINEVTPLPEKHLTRDIFQRGVNEIYDALSWAFSKRLKPTDDFDTSACLDWVDSARNIDFPTDLELQIEVSRRGKKMRTRWRKAALDRVCNIDWTRYNPDAAYFLPDPWFWSETDERAPHGNPVGAAILANWDHYAQLNAKEAFNATGLPEWSKDATILGRQNTVRAHIAFIIAHLKFTATCPSDIARAAETCLQSEKDSSNSPWAQHYKGLPASALDEFLHILEPWKNDSRK